jgi:glycosyltransferase involved in cell wall biosynthesis
MVSILVTTFNQSASLGELFECLLHQTFQDFEVILVNDAGESVAHVVAAYPELAVHLSERQVNGGQTACLNEALALSQGEFLMTCDHDDLLEAGHVARMVEAIEEADLVYADAEVFTYVWEDGVRVPTGRSALAHRFDAATLRQFLTFTPSGMLYRRGVHDAIGPFDSELPWCYWDWDFVLRVSALFRVRRVPVASVYYAFGDGNGSSNHHAMRPVLERLIAKHDLGALKTTNFSLMTSDPDLDHVRAETSRVWDGSRVVSRLVASANSPVTPAR